MTGHPHHRATVVWSHANPDSAAREKSIFQIFMNQPFLYCSLLAKLPQHLIIVYGILNINNMTLIVSQRILYILLS